MISFPRPALFALVAFSAAATVACGRRTAVTVAPPVAQRRAIVVSFDALNEARLRSSVDRVAAPTFYSLFEQAACAAYARPAMPSVTAASHASLWTGAYGDVNGVAGNTQPVLPRDDHTLTETASGFSAAALRAEPIWVTAGLAGLTVVAHHPTQAPWVPGYSPVTTSERDTLLERLRARATDALARPSVRVLNGYNRTVAPDLVLTERAARPRAPAAGRRQPCGRRGRAPGGPPRRGPARGRLFERDAHHVPHVAAAAAIARLRQPQLAAGQRPAVDPPRQDDPAEAPAALRPRRGAAG
jgi:hypothetical protein